MTQERKEELAQQIVAAFSYDDYQNLQYPDDNPLFESRCDVRNAGVEMTDKEFKCWDHWIDEVLKCAAEIVDEMGGPHQYSEEEMAAW